MIWNCDTAAILEVTAVILAIGINWGVMRHTIKDIQAELKELKHRKPELLEFRVAQHDEQLKIIAAEIEVLKTSWMKIESKIDVLTERIGDLCQKMEDNK